MESVFRHKHGSKERKRNQGKMMIKTIIIKNQYNAFQNIIEIDEDKAKELPKAYEVFRINYFSHEKNEWHKNIEESLIKFKEQHPDINKDASLFCVFLLTLEAVGSLKVLHNIDIMTITNGAEPIIPCTCLYEEDRGRFEWECKYHGMIKRNDSRHKLIKERRLGP